MCFAPFPTLFFRRSAPISCFFSRRFAPFLLFSALRAVSYLFFGAPRRFPPFFGASRRFHTFPSFSPVFSYFSCEDAKEKKKLYQREGYEHIEKKEILERYGRQLTDQELSWFREYDAIHPSELAEPDEMTFFDEDGFAYP